MIEFDSEKGFLSSDWQREDESIQIEAIQRHHRQAGHDVGNNERLHATFHLMVERGLANHELPDARRALERLRRDGMTRHEAVHLLARCWTKLAFRVQSGELTGDLEVELDRDLRQIADRGAAGLFDFRAALFGQSDDGELSRTDPPRTDEWETDELDEWLSELLILFDRSPEARDLELGWAREFLTGMLDWGLHPADISGGEQVRELLMQAPMHMRCKPTDAGAIVAELGAFFRFAGHAFDWPAGQEAAAVLEGDLIVAQLARTIETSPDMADIAELLRSGEVDTSDLEELVKRLGEASDAAERRGKDVASFRRASPKVGRNEPCPCGSGKKYKKCCGR